jgi:hypothetical protein
MAMHGNYSRAVGVNDLMWADHTTGGLFQLCERLAAHRIAGTGQVQIAYILIAIFWGGCELFLGSAVTSNEARGKLCERSFIRLLM